MLSFNPIDYAFPSSDKGLDFATQLDEPFSDLFDHHVSQGSSSSSDNINEPFDLGLFDIPGNEDIESSGSYIADQPASNFSHPQGGRLHRTSHIVFPTTRSSQPILQRHHYRSAGFDRPTAAISGIELLSLEGKIPHENPSTQQRPSFSGTPTLTIRRKPKFTRDSLRLSSHRVSKVGAGSGSESPSMIGPSQYHRQETPEWTNRFEQISLITPSTSLPLSPHSHPTPSTSQNQGSRPPPSHIRSYNARQVESNSTIDLEQRYVPPAETVSDRITSNFAFQADSDLEHQKSSSQNQTNLNHGLPTIWTQSSNEEESDFTISPKELQQDWPQDVPKAPRLYYGNPGAVQSAPALSSPEANFSNGNHLVQCNPFGHFIAEDPSEDYLVTTIDPFQMSATEMFTSPQHTSKNVQRASNPSSRSSSVCPSPPPSAKPAPKTRKRSKSNRRKSSAGALKSPKSTGAIGFVNFTPSDSQKILTGVAPSGSSKTKARRELEAIERKRRLSMAAEKAVRDAGGDPEKLRAAGLI
ncbi:MAG: hypothetical protein Q9195_003759 [Heterodermia aff. obscurata]